jgi:hypothetical protein
MKGSENLASRRRGRATIRRSDIPASSAARSTRIRPRTSTESFGVEARRILGLQSDVRLFDRRTPSRGILAATFRESVANPYSRTRSSASNVSTLSLGLELAVASLRWRSAVVGEP